MRFALSLSTAALVLLPALAPAAFAQGRDSVTIYREQDFRGDQRRLSGELRNFNDVNLNDRVSSIRVDGGTWEFCEDADFHGRCMIVRSDISNLAGSSYDDKFSSVRPVADRRGDNRDDRRNDRCDDRRDDRDNRDGGVTLYADVGFAGVSRTASETRDFRTLNFNDTLSSIRIRSGTWEFCTDADFRGRCMTFDRDVPSLVSQGLNDAISSMRRVR